MSTNGESLDSELPEIDWQDIPAAERARPGDFEGIRAAVLVAPERLQVVRDALKHVESLEVCRDLAELLAADADLIVLSLGYLGELSADERAAVTRRWREQLDPIRVVMAASYEHRVALQISGDADLAVEPEIDRFELEARIWALLRRARLERDRNPLTGLPGNRWLRRQLTEMLRDGEDIGLLLLDIDDFKIYNDRWGHLAGDAVILASAEVVSAAADRSRDAFAAHVGGDDFCLITNAHEMDAMAAECLADWARRAPERGGGDRSLPTITVAGTVLTADDADALEAAFRRLATLKGQGKRDANSGYLRG